MTLHIIAAIDQNKAIGYNGDQLAYISEDLAHFKSLTTGHTVVMGRRTNEALPKRRLPNRRNIVLTRRADFRQDECEVAHTVGDALRMVEGEADVFVIGGGEIYQAFMPYADVLDLTIIHHAFPQADAFFPAYDDWRATDETDTMTDPKTGLTFTFVTLRRHI